MRYCSKYLLRLWVLLCFTLVAIGCGSSNDSYVITTNGQQTGTNQLRVQLDVANVTPQISGLATRFDISIFDAALNLVSTRSVTTERTIDFDGVPAGKVLIRVEGFTAGGARLGFFDRVIVFPSQTVVPITTLRYTTQAPPAASIPADNAAGFLALDTVPVSITGGQAFSFGVTAYNADGSQDSTFAGSGTLTADLGTIQTNPGPVTFAAGKATFRAWSTPSLTD